MTPALRDAIAMNISRLWIAGRAPFAPGTWGSAVAALIAPYCFMPLSLPWRCFMLFVIFFIGAWAAGQAERILDCKDSGSIVIDELLGQWIALLPFATLTPMQFFWAFVLFRLFDVLKPWPIRAAEHWMPGGYGVMIDDVLAGFAAMLVMFFVVVK